MRRIDRWFGLTQGPGAEAGAVVLGCPFEGPELHRGGAADGPAAIREWSATAEAVTEEALPVEDFLVVDAGDVDSKETAGEARWTAIEETAVGIWQSYPEPFFLGLGGDHAVTPPLAAAARQVRGELAFLLLDAHPDAFDSYEGERFSHACVLPRLWDRCDLAPEHTCVVGVRSYAPEELDAMRSAGLVVTARRWSQQDSEAIATEVQRATDGLPLYLSLDIDVLDPAAAPGTGYPVAGGPGCRELLDLLAALWARQPVVAMDIVEVAPRLDPGGATAATAAHLCLQAFGHAARRRR